jgi:hypothetical protein
MPQAGATTVQLTQIPPKPTCNPAALPLFGGGPDCQDRWNIYNQAVQQRAREEVQLYVNRQKDLASSQASAPLEQKIADLNKLLNDQQAQIAKLQQQMQADATAAQQARATAHTQGLEYGTGVGVGSTLVLFALIIGIKRLMSNFSVTKKPQAQTMAAGK